MTKIAEFKGDMQCFKEYVDGLKGEESMAKYKITTIETVVNDRQREQIEEEMFSILRRMMDLAQQVRAGEMAKKELQRYRQKLIDLALEYGGEAI
ncbi:hypothetical protein PQ689_03180 [Thermoanaerobacterium thermosaccharolyticum]|uniref:hypothetical protein n=1 Tax=Thermoanaerobacterium thermosaccharolyticum TaxID=1517 RepID=UPI003DA86CA2